jgi:hypothetical protein
MSRQPRPVRPHLRTSRQPRHTRPTTRTSPHLSFTTRQDPKTRQDLKTSEDLT